jgi:hypothetical protein
MASAMTNGYTNGDASAGETNSLSNCNNGSVGPALDLTVLGLNSGTSMVKT